MNKILFIAFSIFICADSYSQFSYLLDKNHSDLSFTVRNFGVTHVNGVFKNFDATMLMRNEDFTDAEIKMIANVKSISTGISLRDKHLLTPKWFEAEKYPELIFTSTSFKKELDKKYKLVGKITINGITKPIVFDVTYKGKVFDPLTKKYFVGFTICGKLSRHDFILGTDEALASAAGDEVDVKSDVEFIMN